VTRVTLKREKTGHLIAAPRPITRAEYFAVETRQIFLPWDIGCLVLEGVHPSLSAKLFSSGGGVMFTFTSFVPAGFGFQNSSSRRRRIGNSSERRLDIAVIETLEGRVLLSDAAFNAGGPNSPITQIAGGTALTNPATIYLTSLSFACLM
jgi:hypothetical protein